MGDQNNTGGAWAARDDGSWWPTSAGEIQQNDNEVARSTSSNTHQIYSYKMSSGFNNSQDNNTNSYDYRIVSGSNREDNQQPWWYSSGSVDNQQNSSSNTQNQLNTDEQSEQSSNSLQQSRTSQQQEQNQSLLQQQLQQHQNLQQALQQNQQQSLQRMLQQQTQQQSQQNQQSLQQSIQKSQQQALQQSLQQTLQVSQSQAQALVQAQAALQQQVAHTLQQQQQTLQEHIQAVQQQQIQAALQRQSATLQELQCQVQQQALLAQGGRGAGARMPRSRAAAKPRGRMTAYAFFVQTCREEHKKKHPDENVVFAAFSKKCAERWNTMLEKEKQRFQKLAEEDKQRYDLEMQNYVPPKDAKVGRGRKRHQVKDPNAPKRSLSAFFWFCNDERAKVKACNPEYTMGDIAKELGRRWAAADADAKAKYEKLSEQDKARYDREMTAYKKGVLEQQAAQADDACDYEDEYGAAAHV